jgi:PAS domain S-box-containing protein
MRVQFLAENKTSNSTTPAVPSPTGFMQFENGSLTKQQLDSLLNTLPVEITFIDENDTLRFFNKPEKVIFVRPKSVIGRKVQNCHPTASLDTVNKIVESFKAGKKNTAEFWIDMANRKIHIRFFAVRDNAGTYLGTMEVVQDVTDIQKLTGKKRLLDWQNE